MKVRKLAVALALAGGLGSGIAQALGLGEIELQSYLNEPLEAEITLTASRGVNPAEVFVNVAPESAYERVGLSRNHFLSKLRFEVVTGPDGNLVVNVSSREPLREPYLNFLLELTWPNGRLMREYAVLVDPPVYAEKSGLEESVAAPVTGTAGGAEDVAAAPRHDSRSTQTAASAGAGGPATIGPTGASDTLWGIAARIRPDDSVSMQQVMLAIQDLNPDAFIGGNINRLKQGQVLRVPTLADIQRRSRAEAIRLVASQNEAFEASRRTVDATAESRAEPAAAVAEGGGGAELRLLVADGDGARDTEDGGSAGGDSQLPGGVDAGTAVAMEELERVRRENEELSSRVEDLQSQVETLQRLLELKNSQLADLQKLATEQDLPVTAEGTAPAAGAADESGVVEAESGTAEGELPVPGAADTDRDTGDVTAGAAEEGMTEAGEGAAPADTSDAGTEPAAGPAPAPEPDPVPSTSPAPQPVADKGFPANMIDMVMRNPVYQIALGGGLVVILLLLLLARRRAKQEQQFLDELNSETSDDEGEFDLGGDTSAPAHAEAARDPLEEAESYISYGQLDQAAQVLEEAISREPSRTDLRLKLLSIYADTQNRESFDKQLGEIEALGDEEALAQAQELKARLEEAEDIPSIDDLESQLRSDSFAPEMAEPDVPAATSPALMADQSEAAPEDDTENEFGELASDISLEDSDLQALAQAAEEENPAENPDGMIDYDLSSLEADATAAADSGDAGEEKNTEEDDFSIDFELPETEDNSAADESDLASLGNLDDIEDLELPAADTVDDSADDASPDDSGISLDDLDDSFLEDLDAELDKVVEDTGSEEEALDELDLDISDEDLALMEEFSESGEPSPGDREADSAGEAETPEASPAEEVPVASELADDSDDNTGAGDKLPEIDEEALDSEDEDDFSFLDGTDEAATKLDLARAYIEMGDQDGARDILEEVALEGNDEQKAEARELLKKMS